MLHLVLKPHRDNLQANTSDPQKLFVLLKVIPAATLTNVRPPLALALVIDTSGSMRDGASAAPQGASKLERAIEATDAILRDARLSENDVVTLIQFDDEARALWPLAPLGNRQDARAALKRLNAYSGGTRMAQGLVAAHQQLARIEQGGVAHRVLLLTDGQAFDANDCPAAAQSLADLNAPLITIGVGDDYNEELLRDLAEIGRGRPYHLPQIEALGQVLGGEVGSSIREVITDLKAQVQTVAGVALDSVTRVYPDLAEMKVGAQGDKVKSAALGNVQSGDYTVFVLELTLSDRARNEGRARLAQVQLSGAIPTQSGAVESEIHDIVVAFTDEQAAVETVDDEVLGYVQQRNADRLVQTALRQAPTDAAGARQSLQTAIELTRRIGNPAITRLLQNSLDELENDGNFRPARAKPSRWRRARKRLKRKAPTR